MCFLQRTAVFDLILEGNFCLTFVRRDVCELSGKWMRYFCCCCCCRRCRFKGPWWQRSELHLQAQPAECRPEKMGLWGTRLEMTPPSGTLKQICSSVSHVRGIIDSSARKNKNNFLSDCWIGCKEKGSESRQLDLEFQKMGHCPFRGTHTRGRQVLTSSQPFLHPPREKLHVSIK